MAKHGMVVATVLGLLAGGSALAGGAECARAAQVAQAAKGEAKHACKEAAQECLNHLASDLRERGWVGIELDKDEGTGALTVVGVEPDSPAMQAGFQKGDVLVALNGVKLDADNGGKIYSAKEKMTIGKTVSYTVLRAGAKRDLSVTLGQMPEDILARAIGRHLLESHTAVEVAQKLAQN